MPRQTKADLVALLAKRDDAIAVRDATIQELRDELNGELRKTRRLSDELAVAKDAGAGYVAILEKTQAAIEQELVTEYQVTAYTNDEDIKDDPPRAVRFLRWLHGRA